MKVFLALFALILALSLGGALFRNSYHSGYRTLNVIKAERVVSSDGSSSEYLVYTEQGTFEDTDSLLRLKFNSSDVYGQIVGGHSYRCLVYGWRQPLWSAYPNIVRCTEAG